MTNPKESSSSMGFRAGALYVDEFDPEIMSKLADNLMVGHEAHCDYCHDPHPARDCCYFDSSLNVWVEQKATIPDEILRRQSDLSVGRKLELLFAAPIETKIVTRCPKCHRELKCKE